MLGGHNSAYLQPFAIFKVFKGQPGRNKHEAHGKHIPIVSGEFWHVFEIHPIDTCNQSRW